MLIQQIIQGLAIGSVYGLIALGYVLIWNTWGVLNFAQGETVTIGAFFILIFYVWLDLPFIVAFILAVVSCMVAAYIIERLSYRPIINKQSTIRVIATIGVGIFVRNLYRFIFGADPFPFPTIFGDEPFLLGGVMIVPQNLWIMGIGFGLVLLLNFFLTRTYIGKAMRATSQDREAAALMGINVKQTMSLTFAFACGIGGIAGVLIAPLYFVMADMGVTMGPKGFSAALLGGIESMSGAMVGGLILGVIEALAAGYISSAYQSAIAFVILIIVLIFKPTGIMGKK